MQGRHIDLDVALVRAALASANALPDGTWLAVNVSGKLLRRPRELEPLLAESSRCLVLEITEADRVELDHLPSGVRIAVDDAGAGYDTLARMESLKPGFLKLGRGALAGVEAESARRASIRSLVEFGREHDCTVIAVGIESASSATRSSSAASCWGRGSSWAAGPAGARARRGCQPLRALQAACIPLIIAGSESRCGHPPVLSLRPEPP